MGFINIYSSIDIELKLYCLNVGKQRFSVLEESDCPWKSGSLWTTMALYMFNLHIPLGYGGLSIVANLLDQHVLHPQTQVSAFILFVAHLLSNV